MLIMGRPLNTNLWNFSCWCFISILFYSNIIMWSYCRIYEILYQIAFEKANGLENEEGLTFSCVC